MIIEIFLAFVAIAFAFAGVALMKLTRGTKSSAGSNVNFQDAVNVTKDAGSKLGRLTQYLYKPKQLNQYLDRVSDWLRENTNKIEQTGKYLLKREKEIGTKLYMEKTRTLETYLKPVKELRTKFEAYLSEIGLLDQANQFENAGYMDEKYLQGATKDILKLGQTERAAQGYRERISNLFAKAKSGLLKGH